MVAKKRKVEIFSAGCPLCRDTIDLVERIACAFRDVVVLDMNDDRVFRRSQAVGVKRVPAVVIDRELAKCCVSGVPNEGDLRAAGIGKPQAGTA